MSALRRTGPFRRRHVGLFALGLSLTVVAVLGLFRQPADQELFQTLGRHDEVTLFCAVTIANASEGHDEALCKLARNVTGWGRIHAV